MHGFIVGFLAAEVVLRLQVVHTGRDIEGQIYVPAVNWALCILGLAALAGFRDSTAIGYAFSAPSGSGSCMLHALLPLPCLHTLLQILAPELPTGHGLCSMPVLADGFFWHYKNPSAALALRGCMLPTAAGVVVVFVMLITTLLVSLVMLVVWAWHPLPVLAIFAALLAMEGVYLSAVLYQVRVT